MNGFENPMRDQKTSDIKTLIGQGAKVKMDGTGNILVKRLARAPVYVKNTVYEENAVSNDILKLPNSGLLEPIDKPFKLFDMKKFQQVRLCLCIYKKTKPSMYEFVLIHCNCKL